MFDKRLLWTGGAIAATVIISLLLVNIPAAGEDSGSEGSVAEIGAYVRQDIEDPEEPQLDYAYILKEYEGIIAVFIPGEDAPEMTFNVLVKFLPDYDRVQLKEGIRIKDREALSKIIEDYIS